MLVKKYNIAFRKRNNEDRFFQNENFVFTEIAIPLSSRYWLADPFLFEKGGNVYLFFEMFDLVREEGDIAYCRLLFDNTFTEPKVILTGHHKSFPYVFEYQDQIYMIPESCADLNIVLYRSTNFPDEWREEKVLVKDIFSVDTILMRDERKSYLLTSEQYFFPSSDKVISCWVRNRLINSDMEHSTKTMHSFVVSEGDDGIRNAGAVFTYCKKQIRPGQICTEGKYGRGIKLFELDSIEPYQEHPIYEIDCREMEAHIRFLKNRKELLGTHTYNSSDSYEVIDFSYLEQIDFIRIIERQVFRLMRKSYSGYKKTLLLTKKIIEKVKNKLNDEETYEAIIDKEAPWVFVSYIADPFYHKNDDSFLNQHQNKREALAMGEVFNKLGYNVFFMLHTSLKKIPNRDFKIIFGHEPNIERAKILFPNAKLIYYGVSTFYEYRNQKICSMTNSFNERFSVNIPPRRVVIPHNGVKCAEDILLIGSDVTVQTYPKECQKRITKIHQSTQNCRYVHFTEAQGHNEFFFLAGTGSVLKGAQALVDFFSNHTKFVLHWVGPIEDDVKDAIKPYITENIKVYGYQRIDSHLVLGLMQRCDFMIYPSGVEGVPGAVLNSMKSGLIPLVTPWASFDGIEELGFVMDDSNADSIEKAINWAMSLSREEISRRKRACQEFVLNHYNIDTFKHEFEVYMKRICNL